MAQQNLADEMRRLMLLTEGTVEIDEAGRLRKLGMAAAVAGGLMGGIVNHSAHAQVPAPTTMSTERITPENHMQLAIDWVKTLPQDVKSKALKDPNIGMPGAFIKRTMEYSSGTNKDAAIDMWIGAISKIAGPDVKEGPRMDAQDGKDSVSKWQAKGDAQAKADQNKEQNDLAQDQKNLQNAGNR